MDRAKAMDEPIRLDKVLGVTTLSNAALAQCPGTGLVAYAAGSLIVVYDSINSKQVKFFQASKAVTCIAFSADGNLIACGEKGHSPMVSIWSMRSGALIAQLTEHKNGVGALAFSPNGQYLISAGFKHDKQLIVWRLHDNVPLVKKKLANKVNSIVFSGDGSFFVTCGDRHLKWWYLSVQTGELDVTGKPASILEVLKDANFTDGVCGVNKFADYVYCTTSTGALCVFHSNRIMDRWVQLDCTCSYALSLHYDASADSASLVVACSNGRVFMMDPGTLMCLATLPQPVPLPIATADVKQSYDARSATFPACFAAKVIPPCRVPSRVQAEPLRVFTIYSDRSIFAWEKSPDSNLFSKKRSFVFHRGCVWDIMFLPASSTVMPSGTFVTCSADNSIRFWNTNREGQKESKWKSAYSKDLLHTIHLDVPVSCSSVPLDITSAVRSTGESIIYSQSQKDKEASFDVISSGMPDTEIPDRPDGSQAPRVLAAHPNGSCFAAGDRAGRIRTFDMTCMTLVQSINAHDAEVLTLQYSPAPPMTKRDAPSTVLLASAGRDRLVHIFEACVENGDNIVGDCIPVGTLDNHSSSVTAMTFTSDGKRLVTCGGDKTMVFNAVSGRDITRIKSVQTPNGTINGLSIDATNKFAVTSGQDKRVNVWNVLSGKHVRAYFQDSWGELYKCDIDPSGMFIATCGFDKMIRILDFFSGEVVTEFYGHSELITAIKFSPDGKNLMSISGDGCVCQWKLGGMLRSAMKERLVELYSDAKWKQEKLVIPKQQVDGNPDAVTSLPVSDGFRASADAAHVKQSSNVATAAKNRWKARIKDEGGYELFGKKISMSASCDGFIPSSASEQRQEGGKQLNKFTIDFSQTERSSSTATGILRTASRTAIVEALDTVQLGDINEDASTILTTENDVDVDGENAAVNNSEIYNDDFEDEDETLKIRAIDDDVDPQLVRASVHLDNLERNASALESWLEQKLRNDSVLDSNALGSSLALSVAIPSLPSPAPAADIIAGASISSPEKMDNHLGKSLTANFFRAFIPSSDGISSHTQLSGVIPPPPIIEVEPFVAGKEEDIEDGQSSSSDDNEIDSNDMSLGLNASPRGVKQRQTAAIVSLMKERLTAMGIVEGNVEVEDDEYMMNTGSTTVSDKVGSIPLSPRQRWRQELRNRIAAKKDKGSEDVVSDTETESDGGQDGDENIDKFSPPPPPDYDFIGVNTKKELEKFSFPSDNTLLVALNEEKRENLPEIHLVDSFVDNGNISAIRVKTNECRKIMSELTSMTEKAMKAFADLNQLRASMSLPLPPPPTTNETADAPAEALDVNHLFSDFRTSVTSLMSFASMLEKDAVNSSNVNPQTLERLSAGKSSSVAEYSGSFQHSSTIDKGDAADDRTLSLLENYSDRLAEMVSAKVMKKLESSNSILSQSLSMTNSSNM